jgi:hypothetical protein
VYNALPVTFSGASLGRNPRRPIQPPSGGLHSQSRLFLDSPLLLSFAAVIPGPFAHKSNQSAQLSTKRVLQKKRQIPATKSSIFPDDQRFSLQACLAVAMLRSHRSTYTYKNMLNRRISGFVCQQQYYLYYARKLAFAQDAAFPLIPIGAGAGGVIVLQIPCGSTANAEDVEVTGPCMHKSICGTTLT